MKRLLFFILILVFVAGAVWLVKSKEQTHEGGVVESGEPLLLLEDEPLLLLDEGEPLGLAPATGAVADNARCHVCHMNYEIEELAVTHARANVGCEKCHGTSENHRADEDHIIPPDIMYSMARINASCMATACHPRDEIDNSNHKKTLYDLEANKIYCTNCHGEHLMSHRTRRWNKDTGELLEDDKVRLYIDQRPEEAE